ncbi:MAG: V-type ATP synthase subunit F [Clostridia bacterium]|nr:V-type ATP synthase subunit F [Clostridia bacterium]
MYNIAVIGKHSEVLGFMALGFDVFPASDPAEASSEFKRLAKSKKYAVIFLTENYCEPLAADIAKYKDDVIPAILPIPTPSGDNGFGMNAISDSVIRAVGSDIL